MVVRNLMDIRRPIKIKAKPPVWMNCFFYCNKYTEPLGHPDMWSHCSLWRAYYTDYDVIFSVSPLWSETWWTYNDQLILKLNLIYYWIISSVAISRLWITLWARFSKTLSSSPHMGFGMIVLGHHAVWSHYRTLFDQHPAYTCTKHAPLCICLIYILI